jgi:hypothetical protein
MAVILTEVCPAYQGVHALKDGYEVIFIPDASGGAAFTFLYYCIIILKTSRYVIQQ